MALMQCRSCSAKFAVGLLRCPQCNAISELYAVPDEVIEAEQEANVPKISVEGGPSNALGQPLETETPAAEAVEPSVAPETEAAMSDATSGASDGGAEPEEDAGADESAKNSEAEAAPASAPKPARKTAAKKAAAKAEPTPKG